MNPQELIRKFENRAATVGVIGLGYVGLPLALAFAAKGFRAVGFDIDGRKVESLRRGESYIRHIPAERIAQARNLEATTDYSRLRECDAILLCVPTPLTRQREPDMTYIVGTCEALAPHLRAGQLVVLESTTYPGTTDEVVRPILERGGLRAGRDFLLAYSPEREDPANPQFTTESIPKVVGGHTPACRDAACALYAQAVVRTVAVSSTQAAEAAKILENTFRAVNIALVNELKMVFARMNIDIMEVIDAAATKPFGFMKFTPGPGLGGHCIPIDPFYLTWKAREFDISTRFIETAGEINSQMPYYVAQQVLEALSVRGRGIKGARILLIGLAYKKNVDDDRESPTYKLMDILEKYGAETAYHDPFVPVIRPSREHAHYAGRRSTDIATAGAFDAVLIATNHDGIDYRRLLEDAQLVVDARGVYPAGTPKVVKA